MDLSVIENDPTEVKKYLQNFVPINYYRVLGDEYLYQVRASLLHSVSLAGLYNPKYDKLINDLVVETAGNYGRINSTLDVMSDLLSAQAIRTDIVEVEAANANASILKIQQASAEQNRAQASVNERLEASLDDIVVGGRNIMKNSDFSKGYRAWQDASITKHDHFIGTMYKISSTGIAGSLMGIYPLAEYQNMAMVEGSQYSISFYAYGSIMLMDEIYLTSPSEAPIKLPSVVISTDLTDRRHITFKAPTGGGGLGIIFGATATREDDWFSISRIKVELGNKPSDWSPAPEDVDGYIAQVQATIDSFKEVQVNRNNAVATTIDTLNSRLDTTNASITLERETNVTRYASLTELTTRLESETLGNRGLINEVNSTLTDRFNSSATRLETLEAENTVGKGRIESLETVTTNLGGVIASQSTTLNARIDGMSGGRNLLMNADFKLGVDTWGTATITNAKNILGNLLTVTNTGTASNYFGLMPVDIFNTIPLIEGKQYVLSFHARGGIPVLNDIWIKATGELPQKLDDVSLTDTLNDKYEIVFTSSFTTEVGSLLIGATGYPKNSWFSVVAVQIEEGNKATSWALSPDDGGAAVAEVSANIEEFKEVQALENKATAEKFTALDVQYGENNARIDDSISVVATTAGNIKAEAKVLMDVNGKISGWKNLNDGTTSSFDIISDKFRVFSNGVTLAPFVIDGTKVRINGDLLVNRTITTPAISGGTISGTSITIGTNFKVTNTGVMTATSGSFTGSVTATSGSFTGAINATSGSFTGSINATSGTFKGNVTSSTITSSSINIANKFKVDTAGNVTATSGTFGGTVTGGSINIANKFKVDSLGKMTATSGTFSGSITGATGTFSGSITGASGTFGGTVYANKISGKVANIADAAIKTAQIDNLAVTTGKIANLAVDTLQIAGNAVTIPRVIFIPSVYTDTESSWQTAKTVTAGGNGGALTISVSIDRYSTYPYDFSPPRLEHYCRILRNGIEVRSWGFNKNLPKLGNGGFWYPDYSLVFAQYLDETGVSAEYKIQFIGRKATATGVMLSLNEVKR